MARLKWEDRKYNGYFMMEGVGGRGKTRTDKDLKRHLAILGFRSYWRKLELYRKALLARLNGISEEGDKLYPDLEEETLYTELRIMLDNLRGEVASGVSGGIKHLLKMIDEIIRLISRVFHPSFQDLAPCFAGSNLSASANPRGPPTLVAAPFKVRYTAQAKACGYRLPSSPGPGNWIQTRPRILEIRSKLNSYISRTFQAPFFGSNALFSVICNSLPFKAFKYLVKAITDGTARLSSPFSLISFGVPRLGVGLAGALTAGSLFFGTAKKVGTSVLKHPKRVCVYATLLGMLGSASLPGRTEGAVGDGAGSLITRVADTWGVAVEPGTRDYWWVDNITGEVWETQVNENLTGGITSLQFTCGNGSNFKGVAMNNDYVWVVSDGDDKIYKFN